MSTRIAFLCLMICLPGMVWALNTVAFGKSDQNTALPVEVTAQSFSVDQDKGTAVFSGDVLIIQGEMQLSAPWVLVVYSQDQSRVERLEARDGVILVSGEDAAEASRADYNVDKGLVVMSGDVLLNQGPNTLTSNEMKIDLIAGTAEMGGKVRTVLQPTARKN